MALEADFDWNAVIPGNYMMAPSASGMIIQPNGQNTATRNINADPMRIVDEAHFDLPLYNTTEASWYSSFSQEMEAFHQSSYTLYRQSAFGSYLGPYTHSVCFKNGRENLTKRCFKFLRNIDEKRRDAQRLRAAANIQDQHVFNVSLQNKSAFQHMVAERNRRVKMKQHFSLLHSFLPHNSKRDKYSILSNTFNYVNELKSRVAELEQRNRALEESLRLNLSNKEGCSSFDQSHEKHFHHEATLVYSSDEIVLEQSKIMPNQLDLRINVQIDPLSSPTSLIIVLLERLKELQLEIVSVQSNVQTFKLEARLLVTQIKGDQWESSTLENVAELVRRTLI